jgi:predicted GIY-YIG superfamily endonuclease
MKSFSYIVNMKNNIVYKIKEKKTDKVIYIGETNRPHFRWNIHTSNQGSFNRNEHYMDVIDEYPFANKKDAFNYQCELQKLYGLKTDYETLKINATNGALATNRIFNETGKLYRPVLAYCYKTDKLIGEFYSTREAERKLNVSNINKVLHNKAKRAGAYYFKYK